MGGLVFLIVAVFIVNEWDPVVAEDAVAEVSGEYRDFTDTDEGDIAQIFAPSTPVMPQPITIVVEKPQPKPTPAEPLLVDCYQHPVLVRDLTASYAQRQYIRADGSTCTPLDSREN